MMLKEPCLLFYIIITHQNLKLKNQVLKLKFKILLIIW